MQHIHEGEATRPDGERGIQQGEGPGVVHPPRVATAPGDADGGDDCVGPVRDRSEEHTSELQSRGHLVCRLLLEKKKPPLRRSHRTRTDRLSPSITYLHTTTTAHSR